MLELVNILDVTCTINGSNVSIPEGIAGIIRLIVVMIQIVVPILLIIWGMIDFAKAVIGGDEDKIKAGQKTFIKRLIAAIIVFLVVTITQLLINLVAAATGGSDSTAETAWGCAKQLISSNKS